MEFPAGVLGVALGTILLPSLAKSFAKGDQQQYSELLDWGLRLCFLLALPSTVALGVISKPLVSTLFEYGQFTLNDTLMTQRALIAYSIGLLGLILIKVLAPAFYSRQDIKTPVKIAIVTLILTQLMNLVFIGPLQHAGLSLSIGLAACFNAGLLFWQLRKKNLYQPQPGWYRFLIKVIIAVVLMSLTLWFGAQLLPDWSTGSMLTRIGRLLLLVIVGIGIYFGSLALMGFKIKHFIKRIE